MAEQTAPNLAPDPMSAALEYASYGWRVIPIGPGKKHPPVPAWQTAATTDAEMIRAWWTGLYRDHGVGVATGPGSGVFVVDVDVSEGKHGDETLADLEAAHGALPPTVEVQTGTGGRHLYYRYPAGREVRNNASSRLGPGLDIRGDGGQVLAPPTIHPNGRPYVWVIGQGPLEHHIARAPGWLLDLICEPVAPTLPPRSTGTELVLPRPADRPGDLWAESTTWREILEADGWTHHHTDKRTNEDHWTRPGKERRDGTSATTGYGPGDTLKVFTSSHPILKAEATYSKFGYLAEMKFGGDQRAAAAWCRGQVIGWPTSSAGAQVEPVPVVELEPNQFEHVAMRGGDALASVGEAPRARWGDGDQVLWACGESILLAGRTGTGKTTLAISITAGLVGLEATCLGFPIMAAKRVLYLGMDRPRQILRALARRFGPEAYEVLNERMVFRKGPLPKDLAKDPAQLLTLAQQYGCDVVIVDSLKDAAVKLTDDEVGGQINRAIQMCNANDVDVMVLHHQRKGDAAQRKSDDDTPTVEDIYGSSWITAGAGSIWIIQGQPGDNVVKIHHVKQPAEPLGPWTLEHDHHAGRTEIQAGGFDMLAYLRHRKASGTTSVAAAKAAHPEKNVIKSGSKEDARAKRELERLVRLGLARKKGGEGRTTSGQKSPDEWFAVSAEDLVAGLDGSPESLDYPLDASYVEGPLDGALTPLTDSAFPQVEALLPPLTPLDDTQALTGRGGLYPPDLKAGPSLDAIEDF